MNTESYALSNYCDEIKLTVSERRVLRELLRGQTNAQISKTLGLAEGTVKFHLGSIFSKSKIKNRQELSVYLLQMQVMGLTAELNESRDQLQKTRSTYQQVWAKLEKARLEGNLMEATEMIRTMGEIEPVPQTEPQEETTEKKPVQANVVTGVVKNEDEETEEQGTES